MALAETAVNPENSDTPRAVIDVEFRVQIYLLALFEPQAPVCKNGVMIKAASQGQCQSQVRCPGRAWRRFLSECRAISVVAVTRDSSDQTKSLVSGSYEGAKHTDLSLH